MDGTVEQQLDAEKLRAIARRRLGRRLQGVGELEELSGVGGVGAVYRARTRDGEVVAVKMMHEHVKSNESVRDRFMREAEILDQVDHPNAVRVFGAGEAETGEPYFVMEFLEGQEVARLLDYSGPFTPADAMDLGEQALDGLAAYHRQGVLHRDLKPSNLFVTTDGTVKLLDFSVARYRVEGRTPTQEGTMLGTPAYMAPEQSLGHQDRIDERTDIFGIGAVLYEVLSGQTVYDIDSAQTALVQAAMAQTAPLRRHAPEVPDEIAAIVDRAVSRDREDRFQSAEQMRNAIREIRGLEPDHDPNRSSPPEEPPSIVVEAEQLEELIDEPDDSPADDATESAPEVLSPLLDAVEAARSATTDAPFRRAVRNVADALGRAGDDARSAVWSIGPYWFESRDGSRHDADDLAGALQRDGFYRLAVEPAADTDELSALIRWLAAAPDRELADEDDLATSFREQEFESIGAGIVELFRWDEHGSLGSSALRRHRDRQSDVIAHLRGPRGLWKGLEVREEVDDPSGAFPRKIESRASDFLRRPKGILSFRAASALKDATEKVQDDWDDALGTVLAELWMHRAEFEHRVDLALVETVADYLDRDDAPGVVELLIRAGKHLPDVESRRGFVSRALETPNFSRLVETVDASVVGDANRRRFARLLRRFSNDLPASQCDEALSRIGRDSEFVRDALDRETESDELGVGDLDPELSSTQVGFRETDTSRPADSSADLDPHRAFAGEVYRFFRACGAGDTDSGSEPVPVEQFHRRLGKLFAIGSWQFSLLFHDTLALVNGVPLRGSRKSHDALRLVREGLESIGCNAIEFRDGLTVEGVRALAETIGTLVDGGLEGSPPYEPSPHVGLTRTDPAEAFGAVDPFVGDDPLEARMAQYYAGCETTLEQYLRADPDAKPDWFRELKHMSQVWTRLCARSRAATLALLGLERDYESPAATLLDGMLLSILMARRLTGRVHRLRATAFAALAAPAQSTSGTAFEEAAVQSWNSAEECAAAVLDRAAVSADALWRTIVTYETGRLSGGHSLDDLPYRSDASPKVESLLVDTARRFARLFSATDKTAAGAQDVVKKLADEGSLRVETFLLHLLADTICLFTRGMRVELSSGWRGIVVGSADELTNFHLPTVRLKRTPGGEAATASEVDLADAIEGTSEYGYVVRRVDDLEDDDSEIQDTLTASLESTPE